MTENELEKQAKLWHVESTLELKKVAKLEERLQSALPKARTRRRWKQAGAVLALTCLPVGGITALVFSTTPKAQIERLELVNPSGTFWLSPDGTVVHDHNTVIEPPSRFQRGSSKRQSIQMPEALFQAQIYPKHLGKPILQITGILPDGALLGNSLIQGSFTQTSLYRAVFLRSGRWQVLPPLPGYPSSKVAFALGADLVGKSIRFPATSHEAEKSQGTLWHEGKPQPFNWKRLINPRAPESLEFEVGFLGTNRNGETLLREGHNYFVLSGAKIIPVVSQSPTDKQGAWHAVPAHIGKSGMLVGNMEQGSIQGAIWTSPSATPQPLWDDSLPYSKSCLYCESVDEEGKVVGLMRDRLTDTQEPYIWRAGRYRALQSLIPHNSGWELLTATHVAGRFVLGKGRYRGVQATYRLTLPPGVP